MAGSTETRTLEIRFSDQVSTGMKAAGAATKDAQDAVKSYKSVLGDVAKAAAISMLGVSSAIGLVKMVAREVRQFLSDSVKEYAKSNMEFGTTMAAMTTAANSFKAEVGGMIAEALSPSIVRLTTLLQGMAATLKEARNLRQAIADIGKSEVVASMKELEDRMTAIKTRMVELQALSPRAFLGRNVNVPGLPSNVGEQIRELTDAYASLLQQQERLIARGKETAAVMASYTALMTRYAESSAAALELAAEQARVDALVAGNSELDKLIQLESDLAALQADEYEDLRKEEARLQAIESVALKIASWYKAAADAAAKLARTPAPELPGDRQSPPSWFTETVVPSAEEVSKFREHFAYIKPALEDAAAAAKKLAEQMQAIADTTSIAASMISGDLLGSFETVLRLAGPEGEFAATLIDAISGPIESLVNELSGDTELAQTLGDAISGVFEQAMKSGDWDKVELALSDAIKDMVVKSIADSMLLAPYVEAFSRALQRWLRNPTTANWNRMKASYDLLMQAGIFVGELSEGVLSALESGEVYTPHTSSSSRRASAGERSTLDSMGSASIGPGGRAAAGGITIVAPNARFLDSKIAAELVALGLAEVSR